MKEFEKTTKRTYNIEIYETGPLDAEKSNFSLLDLMMDNKSSRRIFNIQLSSFGIGPPI